MRKLQKVATMADLAMAEGKRERERARECLAVIERERGRPEMETMKAASPGSRKLGHGSRASHGSEQVHARRAGVAAMEMGSKRRREEALREHASSHEEAARSFINRPWRTKSKPTRAPASSGRRSRAGNVAGGAMGRKAAGSTRWRLEASGGAGSARARAREKAAGGHARAVREEEKKKRKKKKKKKKKGKKEERKKKKKK